MLLLWLKMSKFGTKLWKNILNPKETIILFYSEGQFHQSKVFDIIFFYFCLSRYGCGISDNFSERISVHCPCLGFRPCYSPRSFCQIFLPLFQWSFPWSFSLHLAPQMPLTDKAISYPTLLQEAIHKKLNVDIVNQNNLLWSFISYLILF